MPDLERRLADLGARLEWPSTPDVAPVVRAKLAAAPPPTRRRLRLLPVLVAMAATLLGGLAASPEARSAILRLLRLQGATVERLDVPLPTSSSEALSGSSGRTAGAGSLEQELKELGPVLSLEAARVRAPFAILTPPSLGVPDVVRLDERPGVTPVSLLYAPQPGLPPTDLPDLGLLVTEFRGSVATEFLGKLAGTGTKVQAVTVDGEPGVWLEGAPHVVFSRDEAGQIVEDTLRLGGNTLLWERDGLLLRLEARLDLDAALRLARSFGP